MIEISIPLKLPYLFSIKLENTELSLIDHQIKFLFLFFQVCHYIF